MHEFLHVLIEWLLLYGGSILFLMLVLGIVGLPIPDETLLVLAGWLMAKGRLDITSTVLFAIAGSICGISISYWLGRSTGSWLIKKYGPKLRISEAKLEKAMRWYLKTGKWSLLVGYFIPLFRHLAGYVAGSSNLPLKQFMLFAYTGAIIWSVSFLCFGYFLLIEVMPGIF